MKQALFACGLALVSASPLNAATHCSSNFSVTARSERVARIVADAAEARRTELINRWFDGSASADWESPCQIRVEEQASNASGWTSYRLQYGQAKELEIIVRGPVDRVLESVLPHEVAHAVLVVGLGRPLPRWADEGFALLSESESHQARMRHFARDMRGSKSAVSLHSVLTLVDYPEDHGHMHRFYAASLSLTEYLLTLGGNEQLFHFAADGEREGWDAALRRHYQIQSLASLESAWHAWESDHPVSSAAHIAAAESRDSEPSQIVALTAPANHTLEGAE